MMVCETVDDPQSKPADAIADWKDGDSTFYLRKSSANELSGGDVEADRIHIGGTSSAVWCLGENAFCKAHAWCEGLELEANTMWFVAENASEVPIPELVYSWIDHDLNRTFLITKRVGGQTLERAWPQLSLPQRTQIANGIAQFCDTLAANTSSRFETVTGCGVHEPRLMESAPQSHPTWKPRTLGPLSQEAMRAYLTKISTEPAPDIDPQFHFYHADLGPTNIMVSEDGDRVTGIIDWESAAYYPRFWVATKPVTAGAFHLECETDEPKLWGQLLGQAIADKGYKRLDAAFRRWNNSVM
jgi:aminoglycoside phosphotransferase (APT) family kinase protein